MKKITITLTQEEWFDVLHYMNIQSTNPDNFRDELEEDEYVDWKFHYETLQKLKKKILK